MKISLSSLIGSVLILASGTSLGAANPVSANITFTSDYIFRGISQTDESFAIQGGFDYGFSNGMYVGSWASTIDDEGFNDAAAEIDLYAGMGGAFGHSDFGWNLNALYYYYPGQTGTGVDVSFLEFTPGLTYTGDLGITSSLSVAYSNDYFFESGDSYYYSLDASVPIPGNFTISAHVGHQSIEENATFGVPDYTDWSLGLSTMLAGLSWRLTYVDTNVDGRNCLGGSNLCAASAVVSVSKAF